MNLFLETTAGEARYSNTISDEFMRESMSTALYDAFWGRRIKTSKKLIKPLKKGIVTLQDGDLKDFAIAVLDYCVKNSNLHVVIK